MVRRMWQWLGFAGVGVGVALWLTSSVMAEEKSGEVPGKRDLLQVPSPQWQEQVIYFLATDRFQHGESGSNDHHEGEYEPGAEKKYNGGDLKGIINKLDYLAELGVTAVWITPPVANMWWDPTVSSSGYLGYWAENFREVDKHLGNLETLQNLSRALHQRGMYLIQDIVCTHVGNFFYYDGPYDAGHPWRHFKRNTKAVPHNIPTQKPFDQNDASDERERKAAIYHFTPDITDMNDMRQVLNYQLDGLDHLNTKTPEVRQTLKESYAYWIRMAGVDGFGLASAIHTTRDFWNDFLHSPDPDHPGVKQVAKSLGKDDFFTFGEVNLHADPYDDKPDKTAASYLGTVAHPGMDGVLNFPLNTALIQVFVDGEPTALLSHRLNNAMTLYRDPLKLVNFIDRHDMERISARTDGRSVAQALTFLLTMPGIPAIYYGTEQGATVQRAAMFARGYAANGKNHFGVRSPAFLWLKQLIALRKGHPALAHGELTLLADDKTGRGLFAFKRSYEGQSLFVILNTARYPVLMVHLATSLAGYTHLLPVASTEGSSTLELVADQDGLVTDKIPPQSAMVFVAAPREATKGDAGAQKTKDPDIALQTSVAISAFGDNDHFKKNFILQGESRNTGEVFVVIDGDMSRPLKTTMDGLGTWQTEIPVTALAAGVHQLAAYSLSGVRYVAARPTFIFVENDWHAVGEESDPIGDDHGPKGLYGYPMDNTFAHQGDIAKLTALRSGTNLKLRITMAGALARGWQPKLGFDHVSFSIFLDIPALRGTQAVAQSTAKVMPFHNAQLPHELKWNRMAFISGWGAALYTPEGAGPASYGKTVYPAPTLTVDPAHNAFEIIFAAQALGDPASLTGTKVYVASWDYDPMEKRLRPLAIPPSSFGFSGGGPGDPLIMDDAMVTVGE